MRLSKKLADAPFSPKERFVRFVEYAAAHKDEGELQVSIPRRKLGMLGNRHWSRLKDIGYFWNRNRSK